VTALAAVISACGGSGGGSTADTTAPAVAAPEVVAVAPADCSVADINQWIESRMRDDYIYYDQVPQLNLDDYEDPVLLLADLRVAPDIYSSVVDQAENQLLIENSTVTRFGFRVALASDGITHFVDISGNSPMANAGILRGQTAGRKWCGL